MARTTPSTSLKASIDRFICNPPYAEPERHWRPEGETRSFDLLEGRRQPPPWWPRAIPKPSTIPAF